MNLSALPKWAGIREAHRKLPVPLASASFHRHHQFLHLRGSLTGHARSKDGTAYSYYIYLLPLQLEVPRIGCGELI